MLRINNSKIPIPTLAFGNKSAHIDNSVDGMAAKLKYIVPGLKEYESLIDEKLFRHQSSLITINDLKIAASASTPIRSSVGKTNTSTLIIPLAGHGKVMANGRALEWHGGSKAIFLPNCAGSSESTNRSVLMIDLDPKRLEDTTRVMLGLELHSQLPFEWSTPCVCDLKVGRVSFDLVFRHLASLIDQFSLQSELINQSGLDDSFYRNIAILLTPTLYLDSASSNPNRKYDRRLLDRVCQYIQSHLTYPISLTDLEKVGCMSRRKLHYAFLQRYHCTPIAWVRMERLTLAHERINKASPGTKLTDIAMACGFNKPATFSQYYLIRYGEQPSISLARALAR